MRQCVHAAGGLEAARRAGGAGVWISVLALAHYGALSDPGALAAQAQGALLVSVTGGSLAERIGLRAGDVVVAMNSRAVAHSADFARQLLAWRQPLGTRFLVRRGPQFHTLVVGSAALD